MRWTEEKIRKLTMEEYNSKSEEIQDYYRNKKKRDNPKPRKNRSISSQLSCNLNYKISQVFADMNTRCNNKKAQNYKYYGGRGIKGLLSRTDFIMLWFRDKAYEMYKPSIDRIDNDGNYEYNNCQFIEMSENTKKMLNAKK